MASLLTYPISRTAPLLSPPGANGYGDPKERRQEFILRDVRKNRISWQAAKEVHGLEVDAGCKA
jgi:N-methylhydantoinase B/oxoprolinase/acetone carboxylase alpha subunit